MNTLTLKHHTYRVHDITTLKKKMLSWAEQFNIFCFMDNCHYSIQPSRYECLLATGVRASIGPGHLEGLDHFLSQEWSFGHLSYELGNQLHHRPSIRADRTGFPGFFFFHPLNILQLQDDQLTITAPDPEEVYRQLMQAGIKEAQVEPVQMQPQLTKDDYLDKIRGLQQHIRRGDCYEINFCQAFYAEEANVHPVHLYRLLSSASPMPFSCLYRLDDKYLLCASPERFIMKSGDRILSQPMKGTIRRHVHDMAEDMALKEELRNSKKERSENVMIVDLVRNDLTRVCRDATVQVDELFGVYTYPQVHQMVSTISGELRPDAGFKEILEATFPMGSMTGAPKYRVMELIEEAEPWARGIFSGSVGYVNPEGDFDFNVVIRSLMYNATTRYLSYQVGSGITIYSDPEKEWEECLLKAEAIKKVLTGGPAPEDL